MGIVKLKDLFSDPTLQALSKLQQQSSRHGRFYRYGRDKLYFYGGCESINSLHSNISIYILNTLLYTFSLVLTREICLTIKASDRRLATISFIVKILLTF